MHTNSFKDKQIDKKVVKARSQQYFLIDILNRFLITAPGDDLYLIKYLKCTIQVKRKCILYMCDG